ncbi:hypothetical protein D9M69_397420 [compost metagenome]
MATTEPRPLKVLTPALATRLHDFNSAARELQRLGIRLIGFFPAEHRLVITPDGGRQLASARLVDGYQRHASAGSTRFTVLFQGVTLEWRETISYRDYAKTIH